MPEQIKHIIVNFNFANGSALLLSVTQTYTYLMNCHNFPF